MNIIFNSINGGFQSVPKENIDQLMTSSGNILTGKVKYFVVVRGRKIEVDEANFDSVSNKLDN